MTPDELRHLLKDTGALRHGHFRLSSGLHSPTYVQCALLLQYPQHCSRVAEALAEPYRAAPPQLVASPALGGIVLGYELARQLGARAIFLERSHDGALVLRRGFSVRAGERVLVAEDVITTGGSTRETIQAMRDQGGEVVGVTAVIDRSGGRVDFGVPLRAVLVDEIESYSPDRCPACRRGVPVEKPGSRPAQGRLA